MVRTPVSTTATAFGPFRAGLLLTLLLVVPAPAPVIGQPAPPPPRSLLPEGFGAPNPEPSAPAAPLPGTAPEAPALPGTADLAEAPEDAPLAGLGAPPTTTPFRDPLAARSSADTEFAGVLTPRNGGFAEDAFAAADGRFLITLARRLEAPIASRWAAITLRRALLTRATPPARISAGDWVAARALLLMRMGEIDAAKLLVDRLPVEAYSAATYRVAGQVALAAADLGALCPIARTGRQISEDKMWEMALGICAALEGDDISAAALFDRLQQQQGDVSGFDVRLAERVATMAGGGGRATNINWKEAPPLTPWRFGVAVASGLAVPADALAALGPARHGWLIRQPGIAPEIRLAALPIAAVQGSASARELVSGIAAFAPDADADADSPPARLRTAAAGVSVSARLAAMQAIWSAAVPGLSPQAARYAGLLQTGPAAARLAPASATAAASADVIASLLASGNIQAARRWWPVAQSEGGAVRARAWALLAVSGSVPATPDEFRDWQSDTSADDHAAARLLAALTGLGLTRGGGWSGLVDDLLPTTDSGWSRAIRAAGKARRSGAVALLAATGLQGTWADVPALHILAITEALVASGHAEDARLFAAEALTRT